MQEIIKNRILDQLYKILCRTPAGIKEYELYQQLKKTGISPFHDSNLSDELILYRIHFLLFHLLYTLQDRLRATEGEDLEIHCLNIQLKPWSSQDNSIPTVVDPMRSYYMEIERLETVQRHEVQNMISSFWQQLQQQEGRDNALAELGLVDPVGQEEIKKQYRKQAKDHHPDRGGDPDRFLRLAAAVEILLP
jgi:DnaJ-domain-containing protein 1